MKRVFVLGALLTVAALSMAAAAFQHPPQGPTPQALAVTKIEKVKDNLYMITGSEPVPREMFSGGNTGVFITNNGGSGLEYTATVGKALATVKNIDTLIVGHSPLRKVSDLQEYQRFMTDFVAAIREANKAGKTVDEAASSINLNPKYPATKTIATKQQSRSYTTKLKRRLRAEYRLGRLFRGIFVVQN